MPVDNFEFFKSVGGVPIAQGPTDTPAWYFGWVPHKPSVEAYLHNLRREMFASIGQPLAGSGAGRTILLHEAARKVWGRDLDVGPQGIGDCVSWGFAGSVDLVACLAVVAGEAEDDIPDGSFWVDANTCTNMLQQGDSFAVSQFDGYPRRAAVMAAFSR